MAKRNHRYESEIRFGLTAIVLVLVILNFVSLFIISRARATKLEETGRTLHAAAVVISRAAQLAYPAPLSLADLESLRQQHQLHALYLLPSRPQEQTVAARRQWFVSVAQHVPQDRLPDLASKLIEADFTTVTRAENDEYYYLYPVPSGAGHSLLVISRSVPELAWLDDAGETILIVGLAALGLMIVTMLFLYRAIIAPMYALRSQAAKAGRLASDQRVDVETVVEEYRRIIDELQESRTQLETLNAEISQRADSLEHFNSYLLRAVDSGVVTLSPDGQVQTLNSAAGRLLDIEPDRAVGMSYATVFAVSDSLLLAVQAALAHLPNSGYAEYSFFRPSFGPVTIGVTISIIRDHKDNRIGVSILLNDVTELVELRHQLEERTRLAALGEMAGGLAHQLRNAMGVIAGYATLIKKRQLHAGESIETIQSLLLETSEAEALVRQFLDFARPCELQHSTVTMATVIDEVLETFRVRSDCADMTFRVDHEDPGLRVSIDALLFKQALKNLVDNAVAAYDEGYGAVSICSRLTPEGLSIDVIDSGRGIAADKIEQIFTPFYSSRPSGTGLGLPLARKMIELHGGTLQLQQTSNQGTIFRLALPVTCCVAMESDVRTGLVSPH